MKTLILGSGAREHAIAWAFAQSRTNSGLFCLPGNAATAELGTNLHGDPENIAAVLKATQYTGSKLVIVGPEAPLAAGVADSLREAGLAVFGPGKEAAKLEASKSFARALTDRAGIPSAATKQFIAFNDFAAWLPGKEGNKLVLKKSGLAAGKGVFESADPNELKAFAKKVLQSDTVLVEEFLEGYELSVFALCDGEDYILMPACADHKKSGEGNQGQNTGGMGAICPVPCSDPDLMRRIESIIIEPTFRMLWQEGLLYRGGLFFGIMVTASGPKLLEFNVRFGDPETQSLLPLLASDAIDLFWTVSTGRVRELQLEYRPLTAVGITLAAPGYPGAYPAHIPVQALPASSANALLFHASTLRDAEGQLRTGGGRCFSAVGLGQDYFQAHSRALKLAEAVHFEGVWFRHDIGRAFCKDS
ncbi:MAG: phosphoribosylamine--glycine ligase [Spirochaetes bacterium GWC1_61_12]|nr:MAG: phosphoribosylamine--glycine ligase [Spirochaetes bacterium GWC1_61_12]